VVPGSGFFVGPPQHGFLRLNFSNQSEASIEIGMARLGRTLFDLQQASRSGEATPRFSRRCGRGSLRARCGGGS
jgi:hypothetical protein